MPTQKKRETIEELKEMIGRSQAVIICEYRGLTVSRIGDLRGRVRKVGGEMRVTKNTLMGIALAESGLPVAEQHAPGPNVYTMAYGDPSAVAKALRDFSKEKGNDFLIIKGAVFGSSVLDAQGVAALADLPPRDVLLAQVVGTIAAPLRALVTVLSGPARGFVSCLSQIREQKEKTAA
jgi:large subunit ribosomal protein L10